MNKYETEISYLKDQIDAWKDASGLECGGDPDGVTPKMLESHITNLDRNIEALDKSSALALKERDRLSMTISDLECKNSGPEWFFFGKYVVNCGYCDVCLAKKFK